MTWEVSPRFRSIATSAVACAALIGVAVAWRHPLPLAACAFVLVVAVGRSDLSWLSRTPATRIARRAIRVLVYFPAAVVAGIPFLKTNISALAIGLAIGFMPILFELHNLRTMFSDTFLVMAPITGSRRAMDLIYFGLGGLAQEYLYRGLILVALLSLSRPLAVLISAAAFVAEHLLQGGGLAYWDAHDVAVHAFLGLALGALVAITGSLPAAMAGHTLYNSPNILLTLRRPKPDESPSVDNDVAFERAEQNDS